MPETVRSDSKSRSVITNILCAFFSLIGIGAIVAAVIVCIQFADTPPILLAPPDTAEESLVSMMDAVCEGDYQQASKFILGMPDLGVDREADDALGVIFWNAFIESAGYELAGNLYATDSGLAQDITFTCLDLTSVTGNLRERSQDLLEQRILEAADTAEVYDENNEYRKDFIMDVLCDAAVEALEKDAQIITSNVTINLKYQDEQWWIVADKTLLNAIFGGILF